MHLTSQLFSSLLFTVLISGAAVPSVSHGPSQSDSEPYVENLPWYVNDIVVYIANVDSSKLSSVSFKVTDKNTDIELNTTCTEEWPAGQTPDTADKWIDCADSNFTFQYTGGQIGIKRSYYNPTLGPSGPPGTVQTNISDCSGYSPTSLHESSDLKGIIETQKWLEVNCTNPWG